jgi:hypothetical protein
VKTITLTAWSRPDYLRRTVDALSKNDTRGFSLVAVLDKGFDPACFEILHGIGFMPKHLVCLEQHHGVNYVGKFALQTALQFGTGLNVYLEEDNLASPDLLTLVNWWAEQPISGFSILSGFRFGYELPQGAAVKLNGRFMQWGWTAKPGVLNAVLNDWMNDGDVWDSSCRATCARHNWQIAQPVLSRVNHIGRDKGTYYTPERYDAEFNSKFGVSDGSERNYNFIE